MTTATSKEAGRESSRQSAQDLLDAIAKSEKPIEIRAPRGSELSCRGWIQEAAFRMLCNNLDPEVGRTPGGPGGIWRIRQSGKKLAVLQSDCAIPDHSCLR